MPSWFCKLRDAHLNLANVKSKYLFLKNCIDNCVLPNGLKLHFNLSFMPNDESLAGKIREILNTASSRILDTLLADCKKLEKISASTYDKESKLAEQDIGKTEKDHLITDVENYCLPIVQNKEKKTFIKTETTPADFTKSKRI